MIRSLDSLTIWLGDFYLLSTVLLAIALAVGVALRQPAKRLAVIKATLVALAILAALCALPRYSLVHLRTMEQFGTTSSANPQAAAFAAASNLNETTKWPTNTDAAPLPPAKPPSDAETTSAVWQEITWQRGLVVAYIAGAISVLGWLAVGQLAAIRLRRQAQPAPAELIAMLQEVATRGRVSPRLGFNEHEKTTQKVSHFNTTTPLTASSAETGLHFPQLLISPHIAAPVALGLIHPAILLPMGYAETQSAIRNPKSAIPSILAHELAHIRNRDLAWLAVSRVLFVLLWAQPLYWLLRRRMRFDQETLADAAAAELTSRQHYAEQLVAWARTLATQPHPMRLSPAVGLWEGASQLRQRVAMLVNANFSVLRVCSRRWRNSVAGITVLTTVGISSITLQPTTRAVAQSAPVTNDAVTKPSSTLAAVKESLTSGQLTPNTIIGHAFDEKDDPVADANVFLFRVHQSDAERTKIGQTASDSEGRFRFDNVIDIEKEFPDKKFPPLSQLGEVILQGFVRSPDRVAYSWFDSPHIIALRGSTVRAKLLPAATLSGQVTGPDGKPVSGALVSIGNGASLGQWEGANSARTNADGKYTIVDATPFDAAKYRSKREEIQRQAKEGANTYSLVVQRPILTITHPSFASKQIWLEQVPGTVDLQLEDAALLEGQVVFNYSRKPAGGVQVHAVTSMEISAAPRQSGDIPLVYRASARTDADGKYRIAALPTGKYFLWADTPGWVNAGVNGVVASGKRTDVPEMILLKGGLVSVRLVDSKSNQPIPLQPNTRAMVIAQAQTLPQLRPNYDRIIDVNTEGRFELRTWPGKKQVVVVGVFVGEEEIRWRGHQPIQVTAVDQQTVKVDVPVIKIDETASTEITGSFQLAAILPPQDRIKQQTAILEKDPNNIDALFVRAETWLRLRDERNALADYEQLLKLNLQFPKDLSVYNNVAYILATSAEDELRNGKRAVELAEKANRLLPRPSPDSLDTLAAAYAEAGDFDRAIRTQKEAIDLAEDHRRDQFRKPLKLYETHKPRREKAK